MGLRSNDRVSFNPWTCQPFVEGILELERIDCWSDGETRKEMGAVSCQRDIYSGVAQRETLQAANQKATETTDGEPEKMAST